MTVGSLILTKSPPLLLSRLPMIGCNKCAIGQPVKVKGHPNIVGLLGNCHSTSVSEFFSTGLEDLVLKAGSEPIPMERVLSMSLDAARGLQALHEVPGGAVVHFDLKPQQLMLDVNGRLKINDLNMCRFTDADAAGNLCSFASRASNPGM